MEMTYNEATPKSSGIVPSRNDFFDISCNWQINNARSLQGTVTTASLLLEPERTNLEDVVSLDTCIALQPMSTDHEPCVLDIKVKNLQRIARIAVVSEASVLEFFKQYGEYAGTEFAEFIDEFQGNFVYFAETEIDPPATEACIKFTKLKTEGPAMWVYGVRLILTEPGKQSNLNMFDREYIKNCLVNANGPMHSRVNTAEKLLQSFANQKSNGVSDKDLCQKSFMALSLNPMSDDGISAKDTDKEDATNLNVYTKSDIDIKTYIETEFHNMESRLMQRVNDMEFRINQKLDTILKTFESSLNRN